MNKVYVVYRGFKTTTGEVTKIIVKTFSDLEQANQYAKDSDRSAKHLFNAQLVEITGKDEAIPAGMSLQEFLGTIGIVGIVHDVGEHTLADSLITVPKVALS